jgi:probable rRNA maturation factor
MQIEVVIRSPRWRRQPRAKTIVKSAVSAAAKAISTPPAELAIVLCDDSAIRALNRTWRGQNKPTNVLSFPAADAGPTPQRRGGRPRTSRPHIGDIIIAYETSAHEAVAEGKPFPHHLAHLAIHGFLHLLGYDHDDDGDAEIMERLERRILKRLAIADPYAERD